MLNLKKTGLLLGCSFLVLALASCSGSSDPVGVAEQATNLEQDWKDMFWDQEKLEKPLSLEEAMARAIKYNAATKTAAMEELVAGGTINEAMLGALPTLGYEGRYLGRNEDNIIEGRSAATGAQSLEPTIFEEAHTRTAGLSASWNILDAGLSVARASQATDKQRVTTERRRKAVQNIVQDVRYAYWRALSAQTLNEQLGALEKNIMDVIKKLDEDTVRKSGHPDDEALRIQKDLYARLDDLHQLKTALATAPEELRALVNLPPNTPIKLTANEGQMMGPNALPKLKTKLEDLQTLALFIRPEMREQTLQKRVAQTDIKTAVLETFPGIGGAIGHNYDSNSLLTNNDWTSMSLSLTGNLMKLFTLPVRLEQQKSKAKLVDMQRLATTAAVLTQTNIADTRFKNAADYYKLLKNTYSVDRRLLEKARDAKKQDQSAANKAHVLMAESDALITRLKLHASYAEAQNAYGRVLTSIGLDPLPPALEHKTITEMTSIIEARLNDTDTGVITALLDKIKEFTAFSVAKAENSGTGVTPAAAPQIEMTGKKRDYNS